MNNLVKEVKLNGIFKKENWLTIEDQKKIEKIIKNHKPLKDDTYNSTFVVNFKTFIKKLLKLKFKNIFRSIYFNNLSKKLNLQEIAEEILDSKAKLTRIDHFWSAKSDEPVIQWHVDNAYSGKVNITNFVDPDKNAIKFFFYLTDVETDNGCLSYIPKSHKIAHALKKGIYLGKIKYQPYWTLLDFRSIILIKENYYYLKNIIDEKLILDFLDTSKLILDNKLDVSQFDHEIKKGGALIFDEAGVHRGSRTKMNDRMVLRFFIKEFEVFDN